ncbi:MAG TPA: class I SAM-dependent methyltransferase [Candidatus Acidoferrales bacterium]|nr:class I SAM-dependent methyltransferase [Candidatus Acidoferrales bacterium]
MNQSKVKVKLSGVSQTLLAPLRGRVQVSKEHRSLFYDEKAIELAEKIEMNLDSDSSASDVHFQVLIFNAIRKLNLPVDPGLFAAFRAKQFDEKAKAFFMKHPHASVVNIGAGLDTTFYRVDNGLIHWYDLDLPEVIDIRRQLLPEPERVTYIAKSLLDLSWCKDINTEGGVFMIAGGVFAWLEESQVKQFFSMLADNFPDGEIVFDNMSRSDGFGLWINQFSQEQRGALQTALMDAMKDWWETAPRDQKGKMIATLETPTKPKGIEWTDIEAWWDQINDKEKGEAMVGLTAAFRGGVGMWTLRDVSEIAKWDNRITVIDQVPTFRNVPRDALSEDMRRYMDHSDESGRSSIIHLRV